MYLSQQFTAYLKSWFGHVGLPLDFEIALFWVICVDQNQD
jgi:hypothetical protein